MTRSTDDSKNDAAMYREAARLLETKSANCGCCHAIHSAGGHGYLPNGNHAQQMNTYFPEGMRGGWGKYPMYRPQTRAPRILALCFMAAMVEAGDA